MLGNGAWNVATPRVRARRTTRILALAAAGALGLLVGGPSGPARAVDGCDLAGVKVWDGGAGTTAWATATNWAGDTLPGATDHVCIPAGVSAAEIVFSTSNTTVQSLDSRKPLTISSGTLTVGNASQPTLLKAGLKITGGGLAGASPRTLGGPLSMTGGTLAGAGDTTIPAGATLAISGTASKALNGPITNQGTITLDGTGSVTLGAGSSLLNAGTLNFLNDTNLTRSGSEGIVTNTGTMAKKAGVESSLDAPIDNDGTIRSDAGTLRLGGGTAASTVSTGVLAAASGASVVLDGGNHAYDAPAALGGPGQVVLETGSLAGTLSVPNGAKLVHTGGTLRGGADSDLTIAAGGEYRIQGAGNKNLERRIANAGTIRVDGTVYFANVARVTNTGLMEIVGGAHLDCCGSPSPHQILNLATGRISHTGGNASVGIIEVPIDNDGIIESVGGRLNLQGGTGATGESTGTFTSPAGAVLALDGGTNNLAGAKIGGAGVQMTAGTMDGPFDVLNGATLTFAGGNVQGPTDGSGAVRILAGGTLAVTNTASKDLAGAFENNGMVRYAGYAYHRNLFHLDNLATVEVVDAAHLDCCGSPGPQLVTNRAGAVIRKVGLTASKATFEVPVDNDGTVTSDAGTLLLQGGTGVGTASSGVFSAAKSGPVVRFDSGTYNFDPAGGVAGPGSAILGNATVAGPWTLHANARLTQTEGALRGPASGSPAVIAKGAKLFVSTSTNKYLSGLIQNLGTVSMTGYAYAEGALRLTNGSGGILEFNGSPNFACCGGGSGNIRIVNEAGATTRKVGAETTVANVEVPFDNDGTVKSVGGILSLENGTPAGMESTGEYLATAGPQKVRFDGGVHVFDTGGSIAGPGEVEVRSGTVSGTFTVRNGGVLAHRDGDLRGGPAADDAAVIEPGGMLRIDTTDHKHLSGHIRNAGLFLHAGYAFVDQPMAFVTASGGVTEMAGAAHLESSGSNRNLITEPGGLIRKTGSKRSTAVIETGVDNDGVVRSDSGILELAGGSGDGRGSTGEYTALLKQTVRFTDGTHAMEAGSTITGPGVVELADATVDGPFTVKSGGTLRQVQGSLRGPVLEGVGPARVEPGGTLHISTDRYKTMHGGIRNEGLTLIDGYTFVERTVAFANAGTMQVDGAAWVDCCGSPGPHLFSNTGTIRKTGTSSSKAYIDVPIDNDGTIRAEAGVLELSGGSGPEQSTGEYTAAAGGPTVRFTGDVTQIGLGGRITGPGAVTVLGGTLAGPLAVKPGGTLLFQDGDLWAPLNNSGQIVVEAGGTLKVAATAYKTMRGPFKNDGQVTVTGYTWFENNVSLLNNGTLELAGGAHVECCGTGNHRITNSPVGLVRVKSGTPVVDAEFDNQGTVTVDAGKVHFWEPVDFVGGTLSDGTWRVKGQLGLRTGGMTAVGGTADLQFEGANAAIVNIDGVDAARNLATNAGTITILNRTHTFNNLTNTGTLALGPNARLNLAKLTQDAGRTVVDGSSVLTATNQVNLRGGMIEGAGQIVGSFNNDGSRPPVTLRPNGELDLDGTYSQMAAGVFEAELTNTGKGLAQRQILGTKGATLGGTLRVRASDTFVPVVGDSYVLGTFASRTGTFSTLDFEALNGAAFEVWYSATEFGVRIISS